MNKLLVVALSLALTGCFQVPRPKHTYQPESVVSAALNDVVALLNPSGFLYCSGVIMDGVILTAAHCVDDGDVTEVTVGYRGLGDVPTKQFQAKLVEIDIDHDVAVLEGITEQMRIGRMLAPEAPVIGSKAIAVGHPLGLAWSVTEGIVVRSRRCLWGGSLVCYMQTSIPLAPGNSGGAIYNSYGEVIGIASFHMTGYESLSGATSWVDLKAIMEKVNKNE